MSELSIPQECSFQRRFEESSDWSAGCAETRVGEDDIDGSQSLGASINLVSSDAGASGCVVARLEVEEVEGEEQDTSSEWK